MTASIISCRSSATSTQSRRSSPILDSNAANRRNSLIGSGIGCSLEEENEEEEEDGDEHYDEEE